LISALNEDDICGMILSTTWSGVTWSVASFMSKEQELTDVFGELYSAYIGVELALLHHVHVIVPSQMSLALGIFAVQICWTQLL